MSEDAKKSLDCYQYALLSIEGGERPTECIVPLDTQLRSVFKTLFGDPPTYPSGRITISVPDTLPLWTNPLRNESKTVEIVP